MPSLTPMVWKIRPTMPAACTPVFDLFGQIVEVHVAGVALPAHAGNADLRLLHVLIRQADAVEHRLRADLRTHLGQLLSLLYLLSF
jgi:hypothetical protein